MTQVDKYCSIFVIHARTPRKIERYLCRYVSLNRKRLCVYVIFNMSTKKNNSDISQNFLQNKLLKLMENVPLEIRDKYIFPA